MTILYVPPAKADTHTCAPPMQTLTRTPPAALLSPNHDPSQVTLIERPALPVGSIWQCDCGNGWIVWHDEGVRRGGYTAAHDTWGRASRRQTRRARKAAAKPPKPLPAHLPYPCKGGQVIVPGGPQPRTQSQVPSPPPNPGLPHR